MKYGFVGKPWWDRLPTVIVAEGPSSKGFDYSQLKDKAHILAVKAAMFHIPFADAGFGVDIPRYKEWESRFSSLSFPVYWGTDALHVLKTRENVTFLERTHKQDLAKEPDMIAVGCSSGYAAINLAVHKRAKLIYLIGYDYKLDQGKHVHPEEYRLPRNQSAIHWQAWADRFNVLGKELKALDIQVFNASPNSAISAFPKITLEALVEDLNDYRVRLERNEISDRVCEEVA